MWLFGDTFAHYATADLGTKYQDYGGGTGARIVAGAGTDGTPAVEFYNGTGVVGRAVVTSRPTLFCGFAWKTTSLGSNRVHSLWDGINGRGQVTYVVNTDGSISAWRVFGNNSFMGYTLSTLLGTSDPGVIFPNVRHHFQFKTTISATVGVCQVKVDGNLVLDLSGQNTRNSEAVGDSYTMFGVGGSNGGGSAFVDRLWACDDDTGPSDGCDDFLGQLIAEVSRPNAAGASSGMTPTSGANYTNVDDPTPDGDTSVVSSSVVGTKDTYGHAALVRITSGIKCVQQVTTARKTTGATRAICHVLRSGGADYDGPDKYLADTYLMQVTPQPLDPATSAAWADPAAVNATEIGHKVTV